jgi:putative transposase
LGDVWHVDEVFITLRGQIHYLWRAVDQDGDVIDILVQHRRNALAAKRFFNKALKGQGAEPLVLITDRLRSYPPAVGKSCGELTTTPPSTPIIGRKCRINRPGRGSDRCGVSSLRIRPSVFSRFTLG